MVWRDEATDSGRLGSSNSPVRNRDLCVDPDFGPTTIEEQNLAGGWNKTDEAVGGKLWRQKKSWGSAEQE